MGFENNWENQADIDDDEKKEPSFVRIQKITDKDVDQDIFKEYEDAGLGINENIETDIADNKEEFELDKFGFVSVLEDYFNKVADNKKEELMRRMTEFLAEYRKILDNEKDERTALKKANKAFYQIIGEEVTGYDAETGKIYFNLEKAKFIKVRDKKAPVDAIKVEYDKYGKPVDPDRTPTEKMMEERRKKIKPAKTGLKMPWRH